MPLTNATIKAAKPSTKAKRLYDERGLYLEVSPAGGKLWRFKYRFEGKEKRIALGKYPDVSLKKARDRRDESRRQLADGIDPSAVRKSQKQTRSGQLKNAFEPIAREWFERYDHTWVPSHAKRILRRLEKDIFPWLGNTPITDITPPKLLHTVRRIEERGAIESAHRTLRICGQVFRYAIATGRCDRDPSADLKGAIPPAKKKNLASITDPTEIGVLLNVIDTYEGSLITKCALQFAPLVFVRPGELRHAEWSEFNLDEYEWRIPAGKMKSKRPHIVPLSEQAIDVLSEIIPLTGNGKYVFPSVRTNRRPMSDNTINAALRRLGYTKEQMTGHGFRSMASTLLNEQGWHRDAIERQLAHVERNNVRAAYNYAEYLPERREMMQAWANHLDELRAEMSAPISL